MKENCRLFLAQWNWQGVFTWAACKKILETFFESVKKMLRFITIYCYKNRWGEHFVALLFDFVRSSKFSAINFLVFFVNYINEGKGIGQRKCQAISRVNFCKNRDRSATHENSNFLIFC